MKILLPALLFLLSLHAYAQIDSSPPIGVRRSFGVWLLKPNLGGDVYEVGGDEFTNPRYLTPYIRASGDFQAIAAFEQFQEDRRKGLLLDGFGVSGAIGGPILFLVTILTTIGATTNGRSVDTRWMLYSSAGLFVGGTALRIVSKKHHRHAYELLHLSIDRYNAGLGVRVTRPF